MDQLLELPIASLVTLSSKYIFFASLDLFLKIKLHKKSNLSLVQSIVQLNKGSNVNYQRTEYEQNCVKHA